MGAVVGVTAADLRAEPCLTCTLMFHRPTFPAVVAGVIAVAGRPRREGGG